MGLSLRARNGRGNPAPIFKKEMQLHLFFIFLLTNLHDCVTVLIQQRKRCVMDWIIENDRPIWLQLYEQLTLRIVTGEYPMGGRMPPVQRDPWTEDRSFLQFHSSCYRYYLILLVSSLRQRIRHSRGLHRGTARSYPHRPSLRRP